METTTSVKRKLSDRLDEFLETNLKEVDFQANLERLFLVQLSELSRCARIKRKRKTALKDWFTVFHSCLEDAIDYDFILSKELKLNRVMRFYNKVLTKEERLVRDLVMFRNDNCPNAEMLVRLRMPQGLHEFGLYNLSAYPGPNLVANLCVVMPKQSLHGKDYACGRYFAKRYMYLLYIKHFIERKDLCNDVQVINDISLTNASYLEVKPKGTDKIKIHIYVVPPDNYFKLNKFLPATNNVKDDACSIEESFAGRSLKYYNSALAYDCTLLANYQHYQEILCKVPIAQECIKWLYIWLRQRSLNYHTFEHMLTYLITYLVKENKIRASMNAFAVLCSFWSFVSRHDPAVAITLRQSNGDSDSMQKQLHEEMRQFQEAFPVVMLDITGYYNVATFCSLGEYKKFQSECLLALRLIKGDFAGNKAFVSHHAKTFQALFIDSVSTMLQYDMIISMRTNTVPYTLFHVRSQNINLPGLMFRQKVLNRLSKGLGKRVLHLVPLPPEKAKDVFKIGVSLSSASDAFSLMVLGPTINDVAAVQDFRNFWGNLATIRRFKDGTTKIAVYMEAESMRDRRHIVKKIVEHILKELSVSVYAVFYNTMEQVICNSRLSTPYTKGSNEEGCRRVQCVANELSMLLRKSEMSLTVTGFHGITPEFCMTEVFPAVATNYRSGNKVTTSADHSIILRERKIGAVPRYVTPLECILQIEYNTKWPNNLKAIDYMKTAVYLEIAKILLKNHQIVSQVVHAKHIDILYKGFVFRCCLYVPKEVGLHKKEISENNIVSYVDTPASLELQRKFEVMPKLIGAMRGLHAHFPAFGPGSAIVKRWLRSQLIDDFYFPEIVLDLMCAALCMDAVSPFLPSMAPQVFFLRFLYFITTFPWKIQALILNFNGELTHEQITDVDTRIIHQRDTLPALIIITPYDNCQSILTKEAPTSETLHRVKRLAGQALNFWNECTLLPFSLRINSLGNEVHGYMSDENICRNLFSANWQFFNLIIHLKTTMNCRRHEAFQSFDTEEEDNVIHLDEFDQSKNSKVPITGFNVVERYIQDLRENYNQVAQFFYDTYGGNAIGVLWLSHTKSSKEFSMSDTHGRRWNSNTGMLDFNQDAVILDFHILGKGVVKHIEIQEGAE